MFQRAVGVSVRSWKVSQRFGIFNCGIRLDNRSFTRCIQLYDIDKSKVPKDSKEALKKYQDKLKIAAERLGFKNVDDMLQDRKEKAQKEMTIKIQKLKQEELEREAKEEEERLQRIKDEKEKDELKKKQKEKVKKEKLDDNVNKKKEKVQSSSETKSAIPPPKLETQIGGYKKPVGEEVFSLLLNEKREDIISIWKKMFYDITGEKRISGEVKPSDYSILCEISRQYPIFILPLPRDDGFEFILLKFDNDTIFFTPLAEFQKSGEQSRPHIIINHYTELLESKELVLMSGEVTPDAVNMNASHVQTLAYVTFYFYVSGPKEVKELVYKFNKDPSAFNYSDVIDALTNAQALKGKINTK